MNSRHLKGARKGKGVDENKVSIMTNSTGKGLALPFDAPCDEPFDGLRA